MINRYGKGLFLGLTLVATASLLMLGCATPGATEGRQSIKVGLEGSQSVPPVASSATGKAMLSLDKDSREISGRLEVSNIKATKAHIHRGGTGENGQVVVTLEDKGNGVYVIPEFTALSVDDFEKLLQSGLYFQVHSEQYPKGELRGQIVMR